MKGMSRGDAVLKISSDIRGKCVDSGDCRLRAVVVICGGMTAIHFLKDKASLQRGQKVLINGASGALPLVLCIVMASACALSVALFTVRVERQVRA